MLTSSSGPGTAPRESSVSGSEVDVVLGFWNHVRRGSKRIGVCSGEQWYKRKLQSTMLTLGLVFEVSVEMKWGLGIVQTSDCVGKDGRKGNRIAQKSGVLVL
jgi:hypothetical protein